METVVTLSAIACTAFLAALLLKLLMLAVCALAALLCDGTGEDDQPRRPAFDAKSWHRLHRHHRLTDHRKARP